MDGLNRQTSELRVSCCKKSLFLRFNERNEDSCIGDGVFVFF